MSKAANVSESEVFEGEIVSEGEGAAAVSIIRGVKLLGLRSKNRRNYDTPGVRSSAKSLLEGARVYIDHPPTPEQPRSYRDAFGVVEGYEYRPGAGHFGNLRFNPDHPLAKQLQWDVRNNPKALGMSINARIVPGKTDRNGDIVVESLQQVRSVDIVTKPGTAEGIFESDSSGDDEIMNLKTMREKNPELYAELFEELKKESQESQEAETLRAQLKAASDALEALKAEEAARKLKDTVTADFTEVLKESAFDADLQKEIVECACQLQEESRKKYRAVVEKMAKAAPMLEEVDDEDEDEDSESKSSKEEQEEAEEQEKPAPRVGRRPGRQAAGSGKTLSLRSVLGIGKK